MLKDKLYESFDDIKSRRGRGGTYDFISWRNIADRMNEVFDMNWSSEVVGEWFTDKQILVRVRVCATNPENGQIFCQEGYGGADIQGGEEAGSPHKSAYSKALKDACRKWGVGLYVEDGQDNTTQGSNTKPSGPPQSYNQAPPAMPTQQAPSAASPAPPSAPLQGEPAPTQQLPEHNTPGTSPVPPQPEIPSAPAPNQMAPSGGFVPPTGPAQQTPPTQQGMPAVPPPISTMPQAGGQSGGANTGSLDSPGTITDVQEMAIKNFAKFSDNKTPDMLIKELATNPEYGIRNDPAPTLEQLTYNEAVVVIREAKTLKR
jgi:hypothetical protein